MGLGCLVYGYGFNDPDIIYTPRPGYTAFTGTLVHAGFAKYYDFYAEMAPYVDKLITHFYDPGSLTNRADVFAYMRLLQQKFKAKNNNIKLVLISGRRQEADFGYHLDYTF